MRRICVGDRVRIGAPHSIWHGRTGTVIKISQPESARPTFCVSLDGFGNLVAQPEAVVPLVQKRVA